MNRNVSCDVYHFGSEKGPDGRVMKGFVPEYATRGAAAADIRLPERVTLRPGITEVVPLRIGFGIPKGWCVKMYPRSSLLPKKGIMSPVSVIDSDYSGMEVHAILRNVTDVDVTLERGERVLQAMPEKVHRPPEWPVMDAEREGGLGSTGER